jgi:hypothetical protein
MSLSYVGARYRAGLVYGAAAVGLAAIALLDLTIVTNGTYNVFKPGQYGLVFNSMALHLLKGSFDIDPNSIGTEGFFHDGRTYAYFGIFPALLRLPLTPFLDLTTVHVERLSCWLAMVLGTGGYVAAILAAITNSSGNANRRMMQAPMLATAILSGPPIMLGWSAIIYHESVLWAWALAMIFVALAVYGLCRRVGFSTPVLAAMALVAGLCLLTRPTTAIGLYAALGLIQLHSTLPPRSRTRSWLAHMLQQFQEPRFYLPIVIAGMFLALAGFVNYARWGNPLTIADLRQQTAMLAQYPDRLPRLEKYGLFNIQRIPFGINYYFFPVWALATNGLFALNSRIPELFDAFELPPSSFFLSDPLTMYLAIRGCALVLRGRTPKASASLAKMLLLGLALPPAMMLMAWYMAFRYRAEFMPLFVALSCLEVAYGSPVATKRAYYLLWLLCLLQIVSTQVTRTSYEVSPLGPSEQYVKAGLSKLYFDTMSQAYGWRLPVW